MFRYHLNCNSHKAYNKKKNNDKKIVRHVVNTFDLSDKLSYFEREYWPHTTLIASVSFVPNSIPPLLLFQNICICTLWFWKCLLR